MAYLRPSGKRPASDRMETRRRSAVSRALAVGNWKAARPTDGLPSMRQRVSMLRAPSSDRLTSRRYVTWPSAPVLRTMAPNSAASDSRPFVFIVYWKSRPVGAGCWPICPAATWMFCSRRALITSVAVRLRDPNLSGSSQTRML